MEKNVYIIILYYALLKTLIIYFFYDNILSLIKYYKNDKFWRSPCASITILSQNTFLKGIKGQSLQTKNYTLRTVKFRQWNNKKQPWPWRQALSSVERRKLFNATRKSLFSLVTYFFFFAFCGEAKCLDVPFIVVNVVAIGHVWFKPTAYKVFPHRESLKITTTTINILIKFALVHTQRNPSGVSEKEAKLKKCQ